MQPSAIGDRAVSKPNYRDIARQAGVGTATVERVLNGRGRVRPELVEKVIIAARPPIDGRRRYCFGRYFAISGPGFDYHIALAENRQG